MVLLISARPVQTRRGFTLAELLVAMALIVFIMTILSQAFAAGIEAFRQLKASGDMTEELREASLQLRRDVPATNHFANEFIQESMRTGSSDRSEAAVLKVRYEAIGDDADDLEARLREVEQKTANPLARRLLGRTLDALHGVKLSAASMINLLDMISPPLEIPQD